MSKNDYVSTSIGDNLAVIPIHSLEPRELKAWWHEILRNSEKYVCYAVVLALPSDVEVVRYQKLYGKELHLITGDACLMLTLTGLGFMGYDPGNRNWSLAVDESVTTGYCLKVAELFKIQFDQFPCLILFRDIRKPEHVLITLKGLDVEEIAQEMRTLFSIVDEATKQDKDPTEAVEKYIKQQVFLEQRKAIWSNIQGFAGKTFEMMMEAFIKASIK